MKENPEVFHHPTSQIEGITLFDTIMLALISKPNYTTSIESILDTTKEILHLRNIAIQNLDNHKSMDQIMKEIKDNKYNEDH